MLIDVVYFIQVISAFVLILLVVAQPSKGSGLGSMGGGNNANSNKTYVDNLTKITGYILLTFIISSFFVTYLNNSEQTTSLMSQTIETVGEETNDK